ncbi:MAG: glycosyltransferase family 4 protein [Candidatus Omnitrophica bacterium]|nr:glycosyltransferase family 4 protein [Candidatus Omnitrophota bacterium]
MPQPKNPLKRSGLAVVETHPIQYHAPIYRLVQERFGIPVTVVYGSDFSISGYTDPGFQAHFAWDTDLLSGYRAIFLSRVAQGGGRVAGEVTAWGLRKILKAVAPKAVLITGYSPRFHQVALAQILRTEFPLLFRGETTDHAHERGPLLNWLRDHTLRNFYRRCTKLLYIGQRSLRHFQRLGCPVEKLVFSPYGVDTTSFQCDEAGRASLRSLSRGELGVSETQKVLLFSGKLIYHKAPLLFLRALKLLPLELREQMVVVFMGSGPLQEQAANLAQTSPAVRTQFLGFKNQTELSHFYHAADLLILPSRHWETWGLVVNEALHHGLPCVVSESVGCAPDLVDPGVTGEIFKTDSEEDCARALLRALALVGRPEIREECRQKVSGYSIERAAEGIVLAYRMITGEPNLP